MSNVVKISSFLKSRLPDADMSVERKLVAVLAADLAGYSRLMALDEQGTVQRLSRLLAIVEELISSRGGKVVSTAGDGLLAEFPSVLDSVFAAIEIQQATIEFNRDVEVEFEMKFRVGISIGDVIKTGEDILGDSVNVAARLQQIAEPGDIYVTRTVRDHLRDKTTIGFHDLGENVLKNLPRPVRTFRVLLDELPEIPPGVSIHTDSYSDEEEASETELTYWRSIAESENPDDYRAYLEQFPEGPFAGLARSRLKNLVKQQPSQSPEEAEIELAFWESIKDQNNPSLFEAYLKKYPEGHFSEIARLKIKS